MLGELLAQSVMLFTYLSNYVADSSQPKLPPRATVEAAKAVALD